MRKRTINDLLPVFAIENGQLLFKDGRVAVGYQVQPLEMEKAPAGSYGHLNETLAGATKVLPVGATVQKLDCYYFDPFRVSYTDKSFIERSMLNHFYNRLVLRHRSYLFISIGNEKQPAPNPVNTLFAWGKAFLVSNPFAGIEDRMVQLPRLGREFTSMLAAAGIGTTPLDEDGLSDLYRMYFNLDFSQPPDSFHRPFHASDNYAVLGEKKLHVVSMLNQAGIIEPAVMNETGVASPFIYPLTHYLQIPHVLSVSCTVLDTEKTLKDLDAENKRNRMLDFLSTQDNQKKAEEITEFTHEVRTYNKNTLKVNVSVIVWEEQEDLQQGYTEQVRRAFSQMNATTCTVETLDTANLFVANAPGNSYHNYRTLLMTGDNAAIYQNYITNYLQVTGGDELLCDRFRNPLRVKLFNTNLNNQNSVTIGPSGSGKSFTIGNFVLQRYEMGHTQIIIDVGGTYLSLVTALGGKYFEYDPERPLHLNPFLVDRNEEGLYVLDGDKINFLTSLLSIIWKGAKGEITPVERAVFTKLLPHYFSHYNKRIGEGKGQVPPPSLAGFYEWLSQFEQQESKEYERLSRNFDFNEFTIVLEPYAVGKYRDVLNSEHHEEVSAEKLICFDMAKIKKNPMLYPVISLLITELALDVIRKFPTQRKYFYMDEAWSMLSDSMGEFVEGMYRTVRKNNGAMCIITQGIREIVDSKIGPAILANAATQIILNHTDVTEVTKLAGHLGFTEHEVQLIRSIRVRDEEGNRELFIKQGDYAKIYLMEDSPVMDAVLTSKPEERDYLRSLQKQYGNIYAAVNQYVETRKAKKHASKQAQEA